MDLNELEIMNEKFKFMGFLDCARWHSERNYYAINMADKKASGEQVLLTHFLGYITNRQTPFEMIFERLDYIFSQLLQDFVAGMSVDDLLSPNKPETSFFVKRPAKNKKSQKENADRYAFVSHAQSSNEENTTDFQKENKDIFYASSRFYPSDYVAIRMTLDILDKKFERSFYSFIEWAINRDRNGKSLECLLYALWVLGYRGVGQWTIVETKSGKEKIIDFEELSSDDALEKKKRSCYYELLDKKIKVLDDFEKRGLNSDSYNEEFAPGHKKNNRFKAKRAICYLRDLLKYKQCSNIFREKIGEDTFIMLENQIPDFLELPGDVWNNNGVFQSCFHGYGDYRETKRKKGTPNYLIRKVYKELCDNLGKDNVGCYPEQFDCTFNFVPRMCDVSGRANCQFCPIESKNLEKNSNHIHIPDEFCHHNGNKFCPFLLFAVGYKVKCKDMEKCPNRLFPQ